MKSILATFFLIIFFSCDQKSQKKKTINVSNKIDSTFDKNNSINYKFDTIILNDQKMILAYDKEQLCYITDIKGDTILQKDNCYLGSEFIDINNDNFKDIKVSILSGPPNLVSIILFNSKINKFIKLENAYYNLTQISNTNSYYSVERYGICDMCWESYISKIDNYKLINIGHIIGHNNDTINLDRTFKIYKTENNNEVFYKKIKYNQKENPWNFFEKYITQNYNIFH